MISSPPCLPRTEGRTFLCSETKRESVPCVGDSKTGKLGNWMSPEEVRAVCLLLLKFISLCLS